MKKILAILILTFQITISFAQRDLRFMFEKDLIPKNLISDNHYDSLIITSTNKYTSEKKIHTIVHFNKEGKTTKIRIPYRNEGLFTLWDYKYDPTGNLLYEAYWINDGIPSIEIFHLWEESDSSKLLRNLGLASFPETNYKLVFHYQDSTISTEYRNKHRTVEKYIENHIISVQKIADDKVYEQKIYKYHTNGLVQSYRNELIEKTELYEYDTSGLLLKKFIYPPANKTQMKQETSSDEGEINVDIGFPTQKSEVPIYNDLKVVDDTLVLKQNFSRVTPRIQRLIKIAGRKNLPYWFQTKVNQNNGVQNTIFDKDGILLFHGGIKYYYDKNMLLEKGVSRKYEIHFTYY